MSVETIYWQAEAPRVLPAENPRSGVCSDETSQLVRQLGLWLLEDK